MNTHVLILLGTFILIPSVYAQDIAVEAVQTEIATPKETTVTPVVALPEGRESLPPTAKTEPTSTVEVIIPAAQTPGALVTQPVTNQEELRATKPPTAGPPTVPSPAPVTIQRTDVAVTRPAPILDLPPAPVLDTEKPIAIETVTKKIARSDARKKQKKEKKLSGERIRNRPALVHSAEPGNLEIRNKIKALVSQGVEFLQNNSLEETCYAFSRTKRFTRGELSLFLLDANGTYLASNDSYVIWKNIATQQDNIHYPVFKLIQQVAKGGGWVTYEWRNAARVIYVVEVIKENQIYFVGCGFYPFSIDDTIVDLVRQAVAVFDQKKKEGKPVEDAFSDMAYRMGKFVEGEIYIFAYDFDGLTYAHGDEPNLVGTNQINLQDENGKFIHKEMIKRLKESPGGVWVDYLYHRAPKRSYVEKVQDAEGKEYFIGAGYYPTADRKALVNLVERGAEHMKAVGKTQASIAFTSRAADDFRFGNLYLFVFDMNGVNIAHGKDPSLVGKNLSDEKDERGNRFVPTIVQRATPTGAWINIPLRNSLASVYAKTVDLGVEKFVIGGGIYPTTKQETLILITNSASSFLETNDPWTSFAAFTEPGGRFIRGDLEIFVFDTKGYCYAYGDDPDIIWLKTLDYRDDDGRAFIKNIINTGITSKGRVRYRLNGAVKEAYIESVKKAGKTYVLGSSMYISD